MITVAVYGSVALIVKADDVGLALANNGRLGLTRALGRGMVKVMPGFMKLLTIVGTAAMLWVGAVDYRAWFGRNGLAHTRRDHLRPWQICRRDGRAGVGLCLMAHKGRCRWYPGPCLGLRSHSDWRKDRHADLARGVCIALARLIINLRSLSSCGRSDRQTVSTCGLRLICASAIEALASVEGGVARVEAFTSFLSETRYRHYKRQSGPAKRAR